MKPYTFGDRLRYARTAAGLTQDELAEKLEVSKSAISAWENNRDSPGFDKLQRLSEAVQMGLDALIVGQVGNDPRFVRVASERALYGENFQELTRDELRMLRRFRMSPDRKRKAAIVLLDGEPEDPG